MQQNDFIKSCSEFAMVSRLTSHYTVCMSIRNFFYCLTFTVTAGVIYLLIHCANYSPQFSERVRYRYLHIHDISICTAVHVPSQVSRSMDIMTR